MRETRTSAGWGHLLGVLVVAPLLVLPVRAAADVWRAPALLPHELGTRGFDVLASPGTRVGEAVVTSLLVAVVATCVGMLLAWPAARGLAAVPAGARPALVAVLAMPLLVPQFATGTGLTTWFLRLGLADRAAGLVLAHLVYLLPYAVLILAPAFDDRVRRLEEAARTAGAGTLARLRFVTLPAAARPLTVAALLGFLVSWSQYGTSLAVGGGRLTLPVVLLPFVERDPQVAATLSLVFLVPPLVALGVVAAAWRRSSVRP
ncbi:MAG: ABC transporter permease subunit [Actinobacteria bacterium]|nr:ABC transporter permease subunit [Actinomycetota bacterium]